MVFANTALYCNGFTFTICALFVFTYVAVRTKRSSDNETVVERELLPSIRPTSSLPHGYGPQTKFVSLCPANFDSRRLGNQLFNFAAVMYVARVTGRRVVMPRRYIHGEPAGHSGWIDRWFDVPDIELVEDVVPRLCPCRNVTERRPLAFDRSLRREALQSDHITTLLTCGWFQRWKYAAGVDGGRSLRLQLRWRPEVAVAVRRFLADHRPLAWNSTVHYVRIGIHVRSGDLLDSRKLAFGYTIPSRRYFRRAIAFFLWRYGKTAATNVQFVVTSDNVDWVRTHLRLDQIIAGYGRSVNLVYSTSADAGFDLALLSACDDVIMSTGTYGWWAGWLAAGTTVYHRGWPRRGSALHAAFSRTDFFPPRWIAL